MSGWIGVDLDGTLATYPGTYGIPHGIGDPIPAMVLRVQEWLRKGIEVRIFTARAAGPFINERGQQIGFSFVEKEIQDWCEQHIGKKLPVTCQKDYNMMELWDDRAVQVIPNTGLTVLEHHMRYCS